MIFLTRYKPDNIQSFNQSDIISAVTLTNFFGFNIDENFNWKIHIDEISKRLKQACFVCITHVEFFWL